VPNFALIGQAIAEIWPFFSILQDGGVRHLEVRNFNCRLVQKASKRHCAKFNAEQKFGSQKRKRKTSRE